MKRTVVVRFCDVQGCETTPATPYDIGRQFGQPRAMDLCAEHAAPLDALLAQSTAAHGTYVRYADGCRCMDCRRAGSARRQVDRLRAQARGLKADDPRHGTLNAYENLGCRCERCRAANQSVKAAQRRRRSSSASPGADTPLQAVGT